MAFKHSAARIPVTPACSRKPSSSSSAQGWWVGGSELNCFKHRKAKGLAVSFPVFLRGDFLAMRAKKKTDLHTTKVMRVRSERREETNDGREVYADHRPTIRRKMSGKLNSPSGDLRLAVHVAHGDAERRVVREP